MQKGHRRFERDRIIFREYETGDQAFIIVKGQVEIFKQTPDGPQSLRVLEKGAMFGEMALIDDQPRMASAKAVNGSVELLVINRESFKKRLEELDPFSRGMIKILSDKARSNA